MRNRVRSDICLKRMQGNEEQSQIEPLPRTEEDFFFWFYSLGSTKHPDAVSYPPSTSDAISYPPSISDAISYPPSTSDAVSYPPSTNIEKIYVPCNVRCRVTKDLAYPSPASLKYIYFRRCLVVPWHSSYHNKCQMMAATI
ncbi:hypothetical protein BgiMline_022514 [Biomphalaria glabrata]